MYGGQAVSARSERRSAAKQVTKIKQEDRHAGKRKCNHDSWCNQHNFKPGKNTCTYHAQQATDRAYERRAKKRLVPEGHVGLLASCKLTHVDDCKQCCCLHGRCCQYNSMHIHRVQYGVHGCRMHTKIFPEQLRSHAVNQRILTDIRQINDHLEGEALRV
jgi:hypothetical protein